MTAAPAPAPASTPAPRLCVIGNSHVACLKLAEDAQAEAGPPPADYFAASAWRIAGLQLRGGRWLASPRGRPVDPRVPAISGGKDRVDLMEYDAFVLVGVGLEYRDMLELWRRHCLWRHRDWRAGRALIGDPAFGAILRRLFHDRPAHRFARDIAAVRPGAPVLILPAPWPAPLVLEEEGMEALAGLRDTPYFAEVAALHRACAKAAAEAAGARIVFQRGATLAAPGFTDPRFNVSAVGLSPAAVAKPGAWHGVKTRPDAWHMNPEFGRTRLADIREALAAA